MLVVKKMPETTEVKRAEPYQGHEMISIGKTRISLNKAMKCVNNAEVIRAIKASVEAQPPTSVVAQVPVQSASVIDNPFMR